MDDDVRVTVVPGTPVSREEAEALERDGHAKAYARTQRIRAVLERAPAPDERWVVASCVDGEPLLDVVERALNEMEKQNASRTRIVVQNALIATPRGYVSVQFALEVLALTGGR